VAHSPTDRDRESAGEALASAPSALSGRDSPVRRSELTCPGHSLQMMAKAAAAEADQVMFDLEDACAVSQKVAARQTVIEALNSLDFGRKVRAFRPNNIRTKYFYRDLIEVVEAAGRRVDVVVIPKIYGHEDVLFVDRLLAQIEENMGFAIGGIKLEALIESADAVLHAEAIAKCTPRLGGLIFGLVDYAGDIGAQELGGEQFFYYNYAKAKTIAAARAAGITCVDGVTVAIHDLDACRRDARMAARMGFDGKWAIHPLQVEVINEAFTPTQEEIDRATRIIAAYEQADTEQGRGAIVVDDVMIDAAQLRLERKRVAIARSAGLL
jgi:citrate lyase subunit beta / citryl-CoA lyase